MEKQRQRSGYVSARQKKKLLELIGNHPELITKVRVSYSHKDCQKTWQSIATECNAIPGAKKTWRQWRKTWQDFRSKTKKRDLDAYEQLPTAQPTAYRITAEDEILGIKNSSTKSDSPPREESPEHIQLNQDIFQDKNYSNNMDFADSISEPESPPEPKVFTSEKRIYKLKNNSKYKSTNHAECNFNCDVLTNMEERKLQVKEDYLKFKKDYLKQKLKLIKEQTEALKNIARELSK